MNNYWAIASLTLASSLGLAATAPYLNAQTLNAQTLNAQTLNAQTLNAQTLDVQMANTQMANTQMTSTQMVNAQMVADGHTVNPLVDLCNALTEADPTLESLQCLLDQSTHLNRAKNLARQRGERSNGGIIAVETEPSMHGPSVESPHQIALGDGNTQYMFTFRVRPRATANYTHESQVLVTYIYENAEWTIDTMYNNRIEPTPVSYAEQLGAEVL